MANPLRSRKRRKVYFNKVTPYVSQELRRFKEENDYEHADIQRETGLSHPRITEILNYENYKYPVLNERKLAALIFGGIITVKGLIDKCGLSKEEKEATIDAFGLVDNQEMKAVYQAAIRDGITPEEITKGFKKMVQGMKKAKKK